MKSKNMIVNCKAESVETAVLKLCVENWSKFGLFSSWVKNAFEEKKKGGGIIFGF